MVDSNRLNISTVAFWCFVVSFSLLPIGLGGDRPIPLGLAQLGLALSCAGFAYDPSLLQNVPAHMRLRWAGLLIVGTLLWAFVQTLPFAPVSVAHPLWKETANVLKLPISASIAVSPEDGIKGLLRLITYFAGGVLAYIFAQDPHRARIMVSASWLVGSLICFYGLVIYVTGNEQILWFPKWAYESDLTATFVNRNHFALYAGMTFTTGLGLLFQSWTRMIRSCKSYQRAEAIRSWLMVEGLPRATALTMNLICIALSHSRAGLVCSMLGIGAFLVLYQIYARSWMRAAVVIILGAALLVLSLGIALQISERFAGLFEDYSSTERAKVYEITWHALKDNPFLGYGLNGFEPEYRLYQRNMSEEFNHAHSDLLESILDLGVIAAAALWSAIALFLSGLWHGLRHRRQQGMYPVLALSVSVMILLHASVDFDLQIPGLSLTWAVLLGIGLAQSWSRAKTAAGPKFN